MLICGCSVHDTTNTVNSVFLVLVLLTRQLVVRLTALRLMGRLYDKVAIRSVARSLIICHFHLFLCSCHALVVSALPELSARTRGICKPARWLHGLAGRLRMFSSPTTSTTWTPGAIILFSKPVTCSAFPNTFLFDGLPTVAHSHPGSAWRTCWTASCSMHACPRPRAPRALGTLPTPSRTSPTVRTRSPPFCAPRGGAPRFISSCCWGCFFV
jgi:hypothetical protein